MKQNDLIFDVGLHTGEDTDYYLSRGFRVVAFEANPDLVKTCRERFADAIERGRLVIVEGAVVGPESNAGSSIKFYRNQERSIWGTVVQEWAQRNEDHGTISETIEVPTVDFTRCLETYGVPHYLKVDIEGMDDVCIRALATSGERPNYVSLEAHKFSLDKVCAELDLLDRLGYTSFKAVQQDGLAKRQRVPKGSREGRYVDFSFQDGASGLFGLDLPGEWKTRGDVGRLYRRIFTEYKMFGDYGLIGNGRLGVAIKSKISKLLDRPIPGWYDTHARHGSVATHQTQH